MSFTVNVCALSEHHLLTMQSMGDAVMYRPSKLPPTGDRLVAIQSGLRTRLPEGLVLEGREAFTEADYQRANAPWLKKLRTACTTSCPKATEKAIDLLLTACIDALAYGTHDTYLLLDEDLPSPECVECLSDVYDACRAVESNLPEHLCVHIVCLPSADALEPLRAAA